MLANASVYCRYSQSRPRFVQFLQHGGVSSHLTRRDLHCLQPVRDLEWVRFDVVAVLWLGLVEGMSGKAITTGWKTRIIGRRQTREFSRLIAQTGQDNETVVVHGSSCIAMVEQDHQDIYKLRLYMLAWLVPSHIFARNDHCPSEVPSDPDYCRNMYVLRGP